MKKYAIPGTDLEISRIAYGCMIIGGSWDDNPITDETKRSTVKPINEEKR